MFGYITDTVQGGWDALGNIVGGVGQAIGSFTSPFFPAPQKKQITGEITQPAGGYGQTFRSTSPESPSLAETAQYAADNWLSSPYEAQYSPTAKRQESMSLAENISSFFAPITGGISQAMGGYSEFRTIVDDIFGIFGSKSREPIPEGPQEIGNSRGIVYNQSADTERRVDVKVDGGAAQVKGLFNQNYQGPGRQVVAAVQTGVGKVGGGLLLGGLAIGALVLLSRRK